MVEVDSSSPFAINEAGLTDIERLGGGFQRLLHAHFVGKQRFRLRPKTVEFVVKLSLDVAEEKKRDRRKEGGKRDGKRREKWLLNFMFVNINLNDNLGFIFHEIKQNSR